MKKTISYFICFLVAVLSFSSCEDFLTITPTDETVLEDFWKTEDDVDLMVNGAYKAMLSTQGSTIIWGSYRSDEVVKRSSSTNTDLTNIAAMNLLPSNGWNAWGTFYTVINDCNLVLKHAPEVLTQDPEFAQGDYEVVRSQMLALRALCYFYLVRTFRDVPYNKEAYESDSQELYYGESNPDSVLQLCINDLRLAETSSIKSGAFSGGSWKNTGYITSDAIDAILADIYLWRASVKHSSTDYDSCVYYVDKVVEARDALYEKNYGNVASMMKDQDQYHLYDEFQTFYAQAIVDENSRESILEWQYDNSNNPNSSLEYYFDRFESSSSSSGELMASQVFSVIDDNANTEQGNKVFYTTNDYRFWNYCYDVNSSDETEFAIRKWCENASNVVLTTVSTGIGKDEANSYTYGSMGRNWVVYRVTDLMLMKAEALVQIAANDSDDTNLEAAFYLVQKVNKRSMLTSARDTLKYDNFSTKDQMEQLVLAERARELCFEGKRWYDLLRFCYRHMEESDIDYSKTLYSLEQEGATFASVPSAFTRLIIRKYVTGGDVINYKLKSEPYLYFPITQYQTEINPYLHQNPVYKEEETTVKQ